MLAGIPLVNYLSPVALLVEATRDFLSTILMALGGVLAGLLFAWIAKPKGDTNARRHRASIEGNALA